MKICVAQTRPVKGDIERNIGRHKELAELAAAYGAGVVIFPELSLTGYEPTLAKELATGPADNRFDDLQQISDSRQITIGAGIPTKHDSDICISMVIFQPHQARRMYSKKYLHPDEEEYFVSGQNITSLTINDTRMALAICYEISVPEHTKNAFNSGASVYIASVAKFAHGIDKALETLAAMARKHSTPVLMANCVGQADGYECAGKTSVWSSKGSLAGQLDGMNEGMLIVDTDTQEVIDRVI